MGEIYGIASFRSRSQVLRLEATLRQAGIQTSVINTPRAVAAGCGLSLRFAQEDMPRVQQILRQMRYETLIGLYLVDTTSGRTRLRSYAKG